MAARPLCLLMAALAPATSFFARTVDVVPYRIAPTTSAARQQSSTLMSAVTWPDEVQTPVLEDEPIRARIVAVAPEGKLSPFKDRGQAVPWFEVWDHIAKRVKWADPGMEMEVFREESLRPDSAEERSRFLVHSARADVFLGSAVQDPATAEWIAKTIEDAGVETCYSIGCLPELSRVTSLGQFRPYPLAPRLVRILPNFLRGRRRGTKKDRALLKTLTSFYERTSSDDLTFLTLMLVNSYVTTVPRVAGITKDTKPGTTDRMMSNCKQEVIDCAKDPDCRAGLRCLSACPPFDQVCAYRCLISYESKTMENFSRCVLQKHNCLCNSAEIPTLPDPTPQAQFRGKALTYDTARDLFIGWLGKEEFSWKVVCGQNPAYDSFASQFQIFYKGRGEGQMWCDPVFKVTTLKGEEMWQRRHYRVKHAATPGTFRFSVMDNGVVSNEFWRIIDVPDDLSWGVFYYAGAANAAGQSYTGALLVSRDGRWPNYEHMPRVEKAFDSCGIKLWELFQVDNSDGSGAPLGLPEKFVANNERSALVSTLV